MVKKQRKLRILWMETMLFLCVLALFAGIGRTVEAAPKVTVKKVSSVYSLTGSKTIKLAKGKKAALKTTVTVTPNKSANKKVTYKSSNKKVATVTNKGVITGKKAGTAKITATSVKNKKKKAIVTVKVINGRVTSVKLNKTSGTLAKGGTVKLAATVKTSAGGSKDIVWTSSNKKVAAVNSKGTVKAIGEGKATITVKAADGTGKKATYTVNVKKSASGKDGIYFPKDTISTIYVGNEEPIRVLYSSTDEEVPYKKISYESSDDEVLYFCEDFEENSVSLCGDKAGTATIKATVDGKSITRKITVKEYMPQYTYEVNFLTPPYSDAYNIIYVKTDNPVDNNFSLHFNNIATGQEEEPMVIWTTCEFADLKSMGKMMPGFLYETDGGYLGVYTFMNPGKYKVTIQEFVCDENGNRITYKDHRGYPVIVDARQEGYIDIKDLAKEQEAWMQSVIDKVTTSAMTKKEKMLKITEYMMLNSIYTKTAADTGSYVYLAAESGVPFWKFSQYEFNSYTSPALLTAFGEMIDYPLENLYGKYKRGTPEWYAWHMVARSIEDGTNYQFCPSTDSNVIDTSKVAQIDLSKWNFYKWYK